MKQRIRCEVKKCAEWSWGTIHTGYGDASLCEKHFDEYKKKEQERKHKVLDDIFTHLLP